MEARQERKRLVFDLKKAEKEVGNLGYPLTVRTLREHIKKGNLSAEKVGRSYLVTPDALERFLVGDTR